MEAKKESNEEFLELVGNIKKRDTTYDLIGASFLELAQPDINTSISNFLKKGAKQIYFYPFFLNSGKHVLVDLPNIIEVFQRKYPSIEFNLLEHFGKSKRIEDIILSDIDF